jgi:hypothetical protein
VTDDDKIRRGQRAEQILNDEVFKDAVKVIRDNAVKSFRECDPKDDAALRHARLVYDITEALVVAMADTMRDGKNEQTIKALQPKKPVLTGKDRSQSRTEVFP